MTTTYTGAVRSFDHAKMAALDAYHPLRQAISDLANATGRLTLDEFLTAVRDMGPDRPLSLCAVRTPMDVRLQRRLPEFVVTTQSALLHHPHHPERTPLMSDGPMHMEARMESRAYRLQKAADTLRTIAEDAKSDAADFDGKPFNGRTMAEYMAYHGASIAALADIIGQLLAGQVAKIDDPEHAMDCPRCGGGGIVAASPIRVGQGGAWQG